MIYSFIEKAIDTDYSALPNYPLLYRFAVLVIVLRTCFIRQNPNRNFDLMKKMRALILQNYIFPTNSNEEEILDRNKRKYNHIDNYELFRIYIKWNIYILYYYFISWTFIINQIHFLINNMEWIFLYNILIMFCAEQVISLPEGVCIEHKR